MFFKLAKADAKQRVVSGIAVAERVDRSGEIFDYASSKLEFEKCPAEISKVTGGKSLGNLRGMHGNIAIGKLIDIGFNDREEAIEVSAKIIDDNEWAKVEEGVYTGFSIGGRYLKRWQDGALQRYTAQPSEISPVDLPCVPGTGFTMAKDDGSTVLRKFMQHDPEEASLRKAALLWNVRRHFDAIKIPRNEAALMEKVKERHHTSAATNYFPAQN